MQLVLVFLWLIAVASAGEMKIFEKLNKFRYEETMKDAILSILRRSLVKRTSILTVLSEFGDESVKVQGEMLMEDVIKGTNVDFSLNFETISDFCLIFVDSHKSFAKIHQKFARSDVFLLIAIINNGSVDYDDQTEEIFSTLWSTYVVNVLILHPSHGSTHVHTYFPFSRHYCEEVHSIHWNRYVKNYGFLHKNRPHFANKLRNLHGCRIDVATFENPPYLSHKRNSSNVVAPFGLQV